jgi:hypothetical protein
MVFTEVGERGKGRQCGFAWFPLIGASAYDWGKGERTGYGDCTIPIKYRLKTGALNPKWKTEGKTNFMGVLNYFFLSPFFLSPFPLFGKG